MIGKIETGLGNYYGSVEFVERDGKYFMTLENYDGEHYVEISKAFYEAAVDQFILSLADKVKS